MLILGGGKKSEILPSYPHLFSSALTVPLFLILCFPTECSCSPAKTKSKTFPRMTLPRPLQWSWVTGRCCLLGKDKTNCRYEVRCELQVKILLNYEYPEFWGRKGLKERLRHWLWLRSGDSTSTHGHKDTVPKKRDGQRGTRRVNTAQSSGTSQMFT